MDVKIQVLSTDSLEASIPKYETAGAAGMDLSAAISAPITIEPGQRQRVPTGIAIQLPTQDCVALVYARSGLAWKHGVALSNGVGVIDSDYTGEIQVLLTNFGDVPFEVRPGDRIAQLVIAPVHIARFVQTDRLSDTERGSQGFGSTGVE